MFNVREGIPVSSQFLCLNGNSLNDNGVMLESWGINSSRTLQENTSIMKYIDIYDIRASPSLRLVFAGQNLMVDQLITKYGIKEKCTIHKLLSLKGEKNILYILGEF